MDEDRISALETRTRSEIDALQARLTASVKELREDALKDAIERLSTGVNAKLTAIEARLTAIEEAE